MKLDFFKVFREERLNEPSPTLPRATVHHAATQEKNGNKRGESEFLSLSFLVPFFPSQQRHGMVNFVKGSVYIDNKT